MTYLLVLLYFLILYIIFHPDSYKENSRRIFNNKALFCFWTSVPLIFLLVFRHDYFGTDTQNYHMMYDEIKETFSTDVSDWSFFDETGFKLLIYHLNVSGYGFRTLLFLSASTYIATVSFLIYRYSSRVVFSYFLFVFYNFWIFNTTMRQCFALTFGIWAILSALRGKPFLFILFVMMATLFHATAIVLLPVLVIRYIPFNKKMLVLLFSVMFLLKKYDVQIFNIFTELTGKDYYDIMVTGGVIRLLAMFILTFLGFLYRHSLSEDNQFWCKLMAYAIILTPIVFLNPAFSRINIYFYFFIIVLLPNLIKNIHIIRPIAILFILYGIYAFTIGNSRAGIRSYPYVYYWEDYFIENLDARGKQLS